MRLTVLKCIGISAVLVATVVFLYPIIIFKVYGRYVPKQWFDQASFATTQQVRANLGEPFYEESEKSIAQWRKEYWWGYKEFEIMGEDLHSKLKAPDEVSYRVRINGYIIVNDIYFKVIGGEKPKYCVTYPLISCSDLISAK